MSAIRRLGRYLHTSLALMREAPNETLTAATACAAEGCPTDATHWRVAGEGPALACTRHVAEALAATAEGATCSYYPMSNAVLPQGGGSEEKTHGR